jgi:hypothetical protein
LSNIKVWDATVALLPEAFTVYHGKVGEVVSLQISGYGETFRSDITGLEEPEIRGRVVEALSWAHAAMRRHEERQVLIRIAEILDGRAISDAFVKELSRISSEVSKGMRPRVSSMY